MSQQAVQHARTVIASARFSRSFEGFVADRRARAEQVDERVVKDGKVHGFVEIEGAGEVLCDVNFPVVFLEKPLFTFGHELLDNSWAEDGVFPTSSATVVRWFDVRQSGERVTFVGARLAVVVTGHVDMRSALHYKFEGRSFTNPVSGDVTAGALL